MATNLDIIKRALSELGLLPQSETPKAAMANDMLTVLNGMMEEWEQMDRDLNWFPQDTLSAVCPIPRWAESGVVSNLAVMAAATMRAPLTETIVNKAQVGLNAITAILINAKLEPADMTGLHYGTGRRSRILTDS